MSTNQSTCFELFTYPLTSHKPLFQLESLCEKETSESNEKEISVSDESQKSINADQFSEDEFKALESLVFKYKRDWKRITPYFNKIMNTSYPQEKLKSAFKTNPDVLNNSRKWYSRKEDDQILSLVEKFGFQWMEICKKFPGRSALSLRDRYYSLIKMGRSKPILPCGGIGLNMMISDLKFEEELQFINVIENMRREIQMY